MKILSKLDFFPFFAAGVIGLALSLGACATSATNGDYTVFGVDTHINSTTVQTDVNSALATACPIVGVIQANPPAMSAFQKQALAQLASACPHATRSDGGAREGARARRRERGRERAGGAAARVCNGRSKRGSGTMVWMGENGHWLRRERGSTLAVAKNRPARAPRPRSSPALVAPLAPRITPRPRSSPALLALTPRPRMFLSVELAWESDDVCAEILLSLLKRLEKDSPYTKVKALRCIRYIIMKGPETFHRDIQRRADPIRDATRKLARSNARAGVRRRRRPSLNLCPCLL